MTKEKLMQQHGERFPNGLEANGLEANGPDTNCMQKKQLTRLDLRGLSEDKLKEIRRRVALGEVEIVSSVEANGPEANGLEANGPDTNCMQKKQLTRLDLRGLSEDKLKEIRRRVALGEVEIVSSVEANGPEANGPEAKRFTGRFTGASPKVENIKPRPQRPSILASLHPTAIAASIEQIRTEAETRAAELIARGNIMQAELLGQFLKTIEANPALKDLLYSQARAHLPEGMMNLDDVPVAQRLPIITAALADLTVMPEKIQAYETARGLSARVIAEIQAAVTTAEELYPLAPQLLKATNELAEVNAALKPHIREQREFIRLTAEKERNQAATGGLVLSSRVTGAFGGFLGGVVSGIMSLSTYAGRGMQAVAENSPIPTAGGVIGIVAYALTHLDANVFSSNYWGEAFLSFTIGAIALPTAVGIVTGSIKNMIKTS